MRRMLVILKHSSALPAQLFDEKESAVTLGCQFGARQEEKKSRCCVQNSRHTVPPSNTAGSGLRVFCFTALIQSHAGRGRLWDCNSPHCRRIQLLQLPQGCSCCWGRAPHRGGHGIFFVSLGCQWVCCELRIWAQTCIYGKKFLTGPVVRGQGEMVLH